MVCGTLAQLTQRAATHAVQSPALLILGEVAALATSLAWFGEPPLGASVHPLPRARPERRPRATARAADELLSAIHRA